ncbi:MAG: permease, partial [Ruminococcus sp.]|nr:permease [Ruminococcus sp.]
MDKSSISTGKRPRNPLLKRVWKDLRRDWRRYLMVWLILVLTIGFVSGMYVANNSMIHTLDENSELMNRESGHFLLSGKADSKVLDAIASGEMADVPAVFRERAYEKAEEEVRKAVDEAVAENVTEQVRSAITSQVEAAADQQIAAAKAAGMTVTDEERQSMIDTALETAMAENFDKAVTDALDEAKRSEEYSDAFADAMDEAKKEIDKEIDENYAELADRYDLNEKTASVPVDIYELFYKDTDEAISGDDSYEGKVRIYSQREEIDLFDIMEGRVPETDSEILIDRMHAANAGIS